MSQDLAALLNSLVAAYQETHELLYWLEIGAPDPLDLSPEALTYRERIAERKGILRALGFVMTDRQPTKIGEFLVPLAAPVARVN